MVPRTSRGTVDMRAVKPAASRLMSGAEQTVKNMVGSGTGAYARNSVKQAIQNVKKAPKALKSALKSNPFAL